MRQTRDSHCGLLILLAIFPISTISTHVLLAQSLAPSVGTTVVVRMMEAVDSDKDPAGKLYRAAVVKAVDAGSGVTIPEGAVAAVTLSISGSAKTAQLSSVVINGQVVAVTSGPASVSAAQSAAGSAVNAMHSLGGPAASSPAISGAPASPADQPTVASAAPASAPPSGPASAAAQGQHWWMCRYPDPKDPSKPALGSFMYYALIPSNGDISQNAHFNGYVQQNYKVTNSGNSGMGFCQRFSDDAATRANSMDMMLKQWASSHIEAINVKWADTPAEDAVIDAKLAAAKGAPTAAQSSGAGSKECAYHATCTPTPAPKPPGR